ncbi:response regulator transcription factor [Flavobacterium sp.]|uniref:response regulator transcription factor n=1 Tax=Flavobacterium sp. TaxID=239 RepID=UPI0037C1710F
MDTCLSIVLVEDNDELRESIVDALSSSGHKVVAQDCAEALPEAAALSGFDLIIIDINLPGENGFSLSQRIRKAHADVGIIIMTARNESRDKKEGYASGADIYMTKPLELEELLAAIQSLGRRLTKSSLDNYELSLDRHHMTISNSQGQSLPLTSSEMSLLMGFTLAPDLRLEKWQIIEILHREDSFDPVRAMVLVIVRLRKKIESLGVSGSAIKMIRNWGYQLCVSVKVS